MADIDELAAALDSGDREQRERAVAALVELIERRETGLAAHAVRILHAAGRVLPKLFEPLLDSHDGDLALAAADLQFSDPYVWVRMSTG